MRDKKEVRNVGSEHESGNSDYETEYGNCKDTEAGTGGRNGEQCETNEAQ
jgi:hypothetical protein